jgi:hypothetical protein
MAAIPADVGGRDSRTKICQAQGEVVGTMPRRNRSQGDSLLKNSGGRRMEGAQGEITGDCRIPARPSVQEKNLQRTHSCNSSKIGDASRGQRFIPEMQRIQG